MSTPAGDFRRVLAEAGEPDPAELPPGERAVAELRAAMAEDYARRLARWQRHEVSRQAARAAYERANAEMGIEGRSLEDFPWMTPPAPPMIW